LRAVETLAPRFGSELPPNRITSRVINNQDANPIWYHPIGNWTGKRFQYSFTDTHSAKPYRAKFAGNSARTHGTSSRNFLPGPGCRFSYQSCAAPVSSRTKGWKPSGRLKVPSRYSSESVPRSRRCTVCRPTRPSVQQSIPQGELPQGFPRFPRRGRYAVLGSNDQSQGLSCSAPERERKSLG